MKKGITKLFVFLALATFGSTSIIKAQNSLNYWKPVFEKEIKTTGERVIIPNKYKTFRVTEEFKNVLFSAPNEANVSLQNSNTIIELPMPNGELQKFKLVESPVMAAELAAQFPTIKTFNVMGIDEPGTYGKLDWTEFGFHGMLFSPNGRVFIDPYSRNNITDYISYYTSDYEKKLADRMIPECGDTDISTERINGPSTPILPQANIFAGTILRTYRFAVACTGEYAVAATGVASPTTAQILSVVTTTVNRVDGVYRTEASIGLQLIANETAILFGNAATDPFNGNNNAGTLINESQTVITANIGSANYDIGHTFSTGGGGLAGLGVVCTSTQKARGITGSPNPVGDAYDIDYVAHEVGHQFSGNHSYNQCSGNATQNPGTMVEPGGGVTIMGYAGICAVADNIANNSIAYFHTISFDEIMTFSNTGNGNTCPVKPATGNNIPVVTGSAAYTIPRSTPFTLTGSASDADGDVLTYSWEEIDNNSTAHAAGTAAPYFRSLVPSSSPSRTFPRLSTILTGATSNLGEYLPSTAQTLNFRLTARDNRMSGGGVHYAGNQVIIAASGPFAVTYPNATGITWASGSTQTVTWSVNSTNTAPVNCANVNILLSTDGGNTFPTVILSNTPNDGTQAITVPSYATNRTTCRIKIEAVGNIFFDINDNNFTITATTSPIAAVAITQTAGTNPMCPGASATFSATPTNGGTAPTYQWQVNGANVGTNSTTYTTTSLTNGQSVTCIMTSNLGGVVNSPATSNAIVMTVGNTVPSVVIAGPTVLCAGASATYTATPTNGGSSPTYQWQVNAINAGTNSSTFTTSALTNGQAVTCIMTSNAGCQATPTVTSNTITVTVNTAAATPFVENFEGAAFPPTGWILQNADNGAVAWGTAGAKGLVRRAAAGNTGSATGSAGIEFYNYNTDTTQVDNLISVPVSLVGASTARMTFKRAYKYYNDATNPSNYHDELRVYISSDCGATFGPAAYYKKGVQLASNGTINTSFTPTVAADWDTDTLDLTAYVNQSVIVKFEVTNRYGNNLYLDDINFTSTTSAGPPVANFTSAATKCATQAIQFTDASTNAPTSWAWTTTPSAGVTITSASSQNPTITFATAGTYTVSHTATNANGTSPSYTQAVVVNARPTVVSTSTTVCSGQSATVTASGANTYSWNTGATTAGLTINPATATTTYTVTGTTTATGCTNTATGVITVNNLPTVVATSTAVCQGSSATITASGANTYSWNTGATTAGLTINPVTATTTYTVTGTNTATTCSNTATGTITVTNAPTMTSAATANTCSGNTLAIALTSSVPSSYSWVAANTAQVTGETTTATVSGTINNTLVNTSASPRTVTYSVTPTSTAGGCVGATQVVSVTVNILPTVTATSAPASGTVCAGTQVTLTGGGANTYTWSGGVTNATAFTPTATLTYTVTGTNTTTGCSNTATRLITVNTAPVMTSATSANICSGTAVNIPLTSDLASTYSWIAANNAQVTGESTTAQTTTTINNTLTNASATTQTVTYSVTPTATIGGCVGAAQVVSITVVPAPTMTNATTASVCTGGTLAIALTSSIPSSYSWIAANNAQVTGESTTTQASTTINNTLVNGSATAQTVTYSVTPTATTGGCVGTTQVVTITVNVLPTVTANSAPVNGIVCEGSQVTLTGGGANTYTWSGGATNATAFTPASTLTYTVTGTITTTGCSNTATKLITVNALPTITATSNPVSGNVCEGSTITLNGGGAVSYTWTGGVTNGTAFTPAASGTYTVTGTDANGCTNTATKVVTLNSLPTVTVNSPSTCSGVATTLTASGASSYTWSNSATGSTTSVSPTSNASYTVTGTDANGCVNTAVSNVTVTAAPNVTVNSQTICAGQSATLTGTGATSFSWNTGDATAAITVNPTGTTSYTVTGSNGPGCQNTAVATVTVNNLPVISTSSSATSTVCSGSGVTLTATGATSYSWNTGDVTDVISVNPSSTATYTATGTDANGCSNTSSITVNVFPVNTPTVSQVGNTLTASGATSYQWYLDANILVGETNSTLTATQNGSYTVVAVDANGCSATSAAVVINGIGIKEVTNTIATNIYPNPTTGAFALEISLDAKNDYTIEISDVLGRVLNSEKVNSSKTFNRNYDFSNEANGVYFITIQGTDKSKTVKRIVLNK